MSNAPFYLLVGIVAMIVGGLALGIFFLVTQSQLPANAATGACAVTFIVIATIAYELMMKPGIYSSRRRDEEKEEPESPKT